jgi:hypothetical protein
MTKSQLSFNSVSVCVYIYNNLPSGLCTTAINALQPPQQSSSLLMALTFIAATILVSTVIK